MSNNRKRFHQQGNKNISITKPSDMAIIFSTSRNNISCKKEMKVVDSFDSGYDIFGTECRIKNINSSGFNLDAVTDRDYDCLISENDKVRCGILNIVGGDQELDIYVYDKVDLDCPYQQCYGLSGEMYRDCCYGQCELDPNCSNFDREPNCPDWGSSSNSTLFKWTGEERWHGSLVGCD